MKAHLSIYTHVKERKTNIKVKRNKKNTAQIYTVYNKGPKNASYHNSTLYNLK